MKHVPIVKHHWHLKGRAAVAIPLVQLLPFTHMQVLALWGPCCAGWPCEPPDCKGLHRRVLSPRYVPHACQWPY